MKWLKFDPSIVAWSVASVGLASITFWLSRGTEYYQLAVGILASAVVLSLALLLFETLWWIVGKLLDVEVVEESGHPPKASSNKNIIQEPKPPPRR